MPTFRELAEVGVAIGPVLFLQVEMMLG